MTAPRVAGDLNTALHRLFAEDERAMLLGEDVCDPYGGAFKVTRGLSTRYPRRVRNTPISEGALVGVASGLALAGDTAIAEIMFADFVTLAFDQLVNFASKSTAMYGRDLQLRLVVRCPTGGNRGYGPTHSQTPQKHLIGVPGLALYEASPLHDNHTLLTRILDDGVPAVLFEGKVLYGERMFAGGVVDDLFGYDLTDGVARIRLHDPVPPDCVLITSGAMVHRAVEALRELLLHDEIVAELLVVSRLYPVDRVPLLGLTAAARRVAVIEESTAGGTWGAEVAAALHPPLWGTLAAPIRLIHSLDSIIPAAAHLERQVLVQSDTIRHAVKELVHG
ncbi:alpha-ketoacid dehydrogenase subunit beta [Micromonospora sp. NPDC000442]|uniref:alpha-ketoacid dehydrogenase subunit beta n=1 Tax=Micromonospora sp. NPDC000442 TaxID=3364217 RepID=UPI0036A557D5